MNYNPEIHHRRSIRLKGYNYAQKGLYFITICIQNKICLLGEIRENLFRLNPAGKMVETIWLQLPQSFLGFYLDEFVMMPNHFHGIMGISEDNNYNFNDLKTKN
jgi:REP element-mobilizing transposase RayT